MKHTKEFNAGVKLAKDSKPLPAAATVEMTDGYNSVNDPVRSAQYNAGVKLAQEGKPLPTDASFETTSGYDSVNVGGNSEYEAGATLARENKPLATNASDEQARGYNETRTAGMRLDKPSPLQHLAGAKARAGQFPSNVSRGDLPPVEKEGKDALGDNRDAQREYDAGVNLAKQQQNLSSTATENTRRGYASVAQPGKPGFAHPRGNPDEIILDVLGVKDVEESDGQPAHVEITEAGGGRLIIANKGDVEVLPPLPDTPRQHRVKLKRDKFVYA